MPSTTYTKILMNPKFGHPTWDKEKFLQYEFWIPASRMKQTISSILFLYLCQSHVIMSPGPKKIKLSGQNSASRNFCKVSLGFPHLGSSPSPRRPPQRAGAPLASSTPAAPLALRGPPDGSGHTSGRGPSRSTTSASYFN